MRAPSLDARARAALTLLIALVSSRCTEPARTRDRQGRADGALVFRAYCIVCHGPDGARPAGPERFVLARSIGQRTLEQTRETIAQGRGTVMPPWRGRIADDELEAVARYVHTLAR